MTTLRLLVRDFVDETLGFVSDEGGCDWSVSERLAFELAWEEKFRRAVKAEMVPEGYTYDVRTFNAGIVDLTGGKVKVPL
jgi:hypothetical protein